MSKRRKRLSTHRRNKKRSARSSTPTPDEPYREKRSCPATNVAGNSNAVTSGGDGTTRAPDGQFRSLLSQLEVTQWLTGDCVFQRQLRRLRNVLRHAQKTVPFYRDLFNESGIQVGKVTDGIAFRDLPLLSRRDIQEAGSALRSTEFSRDDQGVRAIVTSGSTGEPVCVASTPLTRRMWRALTLRDHYWHRRDFNEKLAVIRHARQGRAHSPSGETCDSWGWPTDGFVRTGKGVILRIDTPIEQQAHWLQQQDPGYLLSYPSNLESLARCHAESGVTLSRLRQVRTMGEVLTPSARAACLDAWNVPVVDIYTTQEVGYVALQCPQSEHLHVQSENLIVEVLNASGQPCERGEIGKVVVTTLHNFATPLIRYDIGDYARIGGPCPCGRGLPVLEQVLGRQRNMLVLPTGEKRWPAIGEAEDLRHLPRFNQFQFIQRTLSHIEVKLRVPLPLSSADEERARAYVQKTLRYPFNVTFTYVDEIPRSKSYKFEDFRSELGDCSLAS